MTDHVYAYVCPNCGHLASKHRLVGADVSGPYRCPCGCERMQADVWVGLTKAQLDRAKVSPS